MPSDEEQAANPNPTTQGRSPLPTTTAQPQTVQKQPRQHRPRNNTTSRISNTPTSPSNPSERRRAASTSISTPSLPMAPSTSADSPEESSLLPPQPLQTSSLDTRPALQAPIQSSQSYNNLSTNKTSTSRNPKSPPVAVFGGVRVGGGPDGYGAREEAALVLQYTAQRQQQQLQKHQHLQRQLQGNSFPAAQLQPVTESHTNIPLPRTNDLNVGGPKLRDLSGVGLGLNINIPTTALGTQGLSLRRLLSSTAPRIDPLWNPHGTSNVYINNLPPSFTEQELYNLCVQFGPITSVRMMLRDSGTCYGFVLFEAVEPAKACILWLRQFSDVHPSFARVRLADRAPLSTPPTFNLQAPTPPNIPLHPLLLPPFNVEKSELIPAIQDSAGEPPSPDTATIPVFQTPLQNTIPIHPQYLHQQPSLPHVSQPQDPTQATPRYDSSIHRHQASNDNSHISPQSILKNPHLTFAASPVRTLSIGTPITPNRDVRPVYGRVEILPGAGAVPVISSVDLDSSMMNIGIGADGGGPNLYVEGLPMGIDHVSLQGLFSPHQLLSSRFFRSAQTQPSSDRVVAFVRVMSLLAADESIDRLNGRRIPGWDLATPISVLYADADPRLPEALSDESIRAIISGEIQLASERDYSSTRLQVIPSASPIVSPTAKHPHSIHQLENRAQHQRKDSSASLDGKASAHSPSISSYTARYSSEAGKTSGGSEHRVRFALDGTPPQPSTPKGVATSHHAETNHAVQTPPSNGHYLPALHSYRVPQNTPARTQDTGSGSKPGETRKSSPPLIVQLPSSYLQRRLLPLTGSGVSTQRSGPAPPKIDTSNTLHDRLPMTSPQFVRLSPALFQPPSRSKPLSIRPPPGFSPQSSPEPSPILKQDYLRPRSGSTPQVDEFGRIPRDVSPYSQDAEGIPEHGSPSSEASSPGPFTPYAGIEGFEDLRVSPDTNKKVLDKTSPHADPTRRRIGSVRFGETS